MIALIPGYIDAADLKIKYEIPTARENGQALKRADIEKIEFRAIHYFEDNTLDGELIIKNLPKGSYKLKARVHDKNSTKSEWTKSIEYMNNKSNECYNDTEYKQNMTHKQAIHSCIDKTFKIYGE